MHVRPKKHLGQHFLKEDAIAARIAQEHAQTSRSLDALVQNFRFDRIVELCATASTQQE